MQRIPRSLVSTSDTNPRFVLSGSDNADLFTVNFSQPSPASGLVGPYANPDSPFTETKVIGVESNGGRYYDSNDRMHLGALGVSGRWLAGGVEKGGGEGPSMLRFWDVSRLPNPMLVREIDDTNGSASGIAITKKPGQNQGFLMFVAGITPQRDLNCVSVPPYYTCATYPAAQVWSLTGSFGYADLASGTWAPSAKTVEMPAGFQNINFVNQDDGALYLVGTAGFGTTHPEEGTDTAVLMKVTGDATNGFTVQQVASKVFTCQFDSSRQCAFNAAAGLFVDPDLNVLRLYAGKAWRPDDTNASMTFVEFY
jgi:hypothetical protein